MPRTLVFDRSDRARMEITGASAVATINGLVTNDVAALKDGGGEYAAALTAKGKLVADMMILACDGKLIIGTSATAAPALDAMLGKYVNPRFAARTDVTATTCELAIVGPAAAELIAGTCAVPADVVGALSPYHHVTGLIAGGDCTVVRLPAMGADALPAYAIIAPATARESVIAALECAGALRGTADEWDVLRVEIGSPEWGADMDEATLPQEANFDERHGLSYTKGCYIGQETVARIHFRGHVNRTLRRLHFHGGVVPPRGAALVDGELRAVGEVRSSVLSPRLGAVGIGMVRREVEDGVALDVRWDGGTAEARVTGKAKGAID